MSNLKTSGKRLIWLTGIFLALLCSMAFGGYKTKAADNAVTKLKAYNSNNTVFFEWDKVKSAKNYGLSIKDSQGETYSAFGSKLCYTIKKPVNGRTYTGTLTSYDANGKILGSSTSKVQFLTQVTISSIETNNAHSKITLKWKKNAKAEGYKIYKVSGEKADSLYLFVGTTPSKPYKTIKSNATISFTDSVSCGTKYKYIIWAYNGSSFSDPTSSKVMNLSHAKDGGTVTAKATCTAQGTTVYKCKYCKATMETTHPAALGHAYGAWTTTKEATCQQAGSRTHKCTRAGCTASETQDIPQKDHEAIVANPETHFCEQGGYRYYVCKYCNRDMGSIWYDAEGHKEVEDPEVPATCVRDGKSYGCHCKVCGKILIAQSIIPKTGDHNYVKLPAVAPTTEKDGKTEGWQCSVCGKWLIPQETIPKIKAPSKPKLYYIGNEDNSVNVVFKTPKNTEGYIIYRKNQKGKYKKIYENKNFEEEGNPTFWFHDKKVKNGKTYTYAARAYRYYKGKKVYGKMSADAKMLFITRCKLKKAYSTADGYITLNWAKKKGVTGYIVEYYKELPPSSYKNAKEKQIKIKGASNTSKTLHFSKKGTYHIWVCAYIKKGGKTYQSWRSNTTIEFKYPRKIKVHT